MWLLVQGALTRVGFDEQTSQVLREAGMSDQQMKQVTRQVITHWCAIGLDLQVLTASVRSHDDVHNRDLRDLR